MNSFPLPLSLLLRFALTHCPTLTELQDFNSGRIADPEEINRIANHLGLCESCVDEIERLEPSPLALGLKESQDPKLADRLKEDEEFSSKEFSKVMPKLSSNILVPAKNTQSYGENRFQVLGLIVKESFGTAYLARLPSNEMFRVVIPPSGKLTSRQHFDQFSKDCVSAQTLQHPNIQTPVEFGHWDESRYYYSVNYLGLRPSLGTLTKSAHGKELLPLNNFYSIFSQIIDAIGYAHSKEIWHRHLCPDNIWVVNDDDSLIITICDFGFAMDSRYQFELLQSVEEYNTFMAPESINNDENYIDNRSDIYSIGRILKVLVKVSEKPDSGTTAKLQKIIERSTESRRSDRYQSVEELKTAWDAAIFLK